MILLLGSNNKHKASEVKQIIEKHLPGQFEIKILSDVLDNDFDVEEDGATLEENAYKKAYEYHKLSNLPCFADDTGLEIDALNGEPGVHSARYAGKHGNDSANRKKVLELLKDIPDEKRTAQFRTVICYYEGKEPHYIEGICQGRIIHEERGSGGFGYDSIFVPDSYQQTFAEMNAEQKNDLSHRGKAVRNFVELLRNIKNPLHHL
ncbi:RdgB/HAM1 family non-canonical purine NTP pyrophosphatase [Bacteroidota bacterium]